MDEGVFFLTIVCGIHRAYEERAGDVVRLLQELGVPTTDRDKAGLSPQDLAPGLEF